MIVVISLSSMCFIALGQNRIDQFFRGRFPIAPSNSNDWNI